MHDSYAINQQYKKSMQQKKNKKTGCHFLHPVLILFY